MTIVVFVESLTHSAVVELFCGTFGTSSTRQCCNQDESECQLTLERPCYPVVLLAPIEKGILSKLNDLPALNTHLAFIKFNCYNIISIGTWIITISSHKA